MKKEEPKKESFWKKKKEAWIKERKAMTKKERKEQNIFLIIVSFCLFLILLCSFGFVQYGLQLHHLKEVQSSVEKEATSLSSERRQLQIKIKELNDPEYVAKLARARYFLSKDGEQIYVFPKDSDSGDTAEESTSSSAEPTQTKE